MTPSAENIPLHMYQRKFKYLSDAISYREDLEKDGIVTWLFKQESPERMYSVEYRRAVPYTVGDVEIE